MMQTRQEIQDPTIKKDLQDLMEDLDYGFQSQYEIAAQNVIQYLLQSRDTDIYTKLRMLLIDLLVTGYTFFFFFPTEGGNNVFFEVLNPLKSSLDRNPTYV